MTLQDQLQNPPTRSFGLQCSVSRVLQSMSDPEERAALEKMLVDWNGAQVYRALRDEGYSVSEQQIGRHRRGQCRCASAA